MLYAMGRIDKGGAALFFGLVLITDAAVHTEAVFNILLSVFTFFIYIVARYGTLVFKSDTISEIGTALAAFTGVYCLAGLIRYSTQQQGKFKELHYEWKQKNKQLENAYQKLRETSVDLEEVTILRERNRIAREIHDTVGHTLTTVLIEMEAAQRLMQRDPVLAEEKYVLAKNQVRKGLGDLRESVSVLKTGHEIMTLESSLRLMIDETIRHTGVFVRADISALPMMTEQQEKVIYRALQEGFTNGIRHGGSTAFVFQLKYEAAHISFYLQDNGRGTDRIVFGFGLTAMQQRVREAGGEFHIDSRPGDGCTISFCIPVIGNETGNGN
ncbi:MAG: sensor histidine kinase [Clostridiaceae bacterium]|nr:sensor histidine kinase [Clostridiaceae bacterium]